MMKTKWYKVGAVVFVLALSLISALLRTADDGQTQLRTVTCADDLEGSRIGGIKSYMGPEASKIYFQSLLGREISAYLEYDSFDDAVKGLKKGEVDAVWACDVTADYAVEKYAGIGILDSSELSATSNLAQPRFSFSIGMPAGKETDETLKKLNAALDQIRLEGKLSVLINDYIKNMGSFGEEDMWSRNERFRKNHEMKGSLDIGITGAAPPVETVDGNGEPDGFCVALLDELACKLGTDINIKVLDSETAYSELMSGRVDALFAVAASGNTTQEEKKLKTTIGFFDMFNYRFLIRSAVGTEN
ncbi:MAG: transporter substrate-binding domain-containing protein [Lachnospiraceae bacterium]|nr:transporter substrate-binding domain-containing protein [Lachnospiraceae bacterium]